MKDGLLTFIGYIIFTFYTCGIMIGGVLLEKKTKLDPTISRKLTHLASGFVWVICYCFFGCSLHWVVLNIVGAALLGFTTLNDRFSAFGRDDSDKSLGMFYFSLSTAIVAIACYFFNKELYLYTGIAYYCLSLGDGLAPITARIAGKRNVEIRPSKSLVGTLTVFTVSFLATLVFSSIFDLGLSIPFIASVAALTTITEFYGFKGTDNLFIEFFVFGYLVLYHYSLVTPALVTVMILSPLLAILAVGSNAMTADGGISAFFLFAIVGFFSYDFVPITFIAILFLISTAVSVIGKKLEKRNGCKPEEHKSRRAKQIIAVGLFSVIALMLYRITDVEVFYHIYFLALIEQMADSIASDIGRLTTKKNVNIITFKPIEKGISGGISALGTISALIGSIVLAAIPLAFGAISPIIFVFIALFAFLGTLIDSIAGALLQSLYECVSCKSLIETPYHCGERTRLIKGFKLIDNVAVNYIASFCTSLIGALLIFIGD